MCVCLCACLGGSLPLKEQWEGFEDHFKKLLKKKSSNVKKCCRKTAKENVTLKIFLPKTRLARQICQKKSMHVSSRGPT